MKYLEGRHFNFMPPATDSYRDGWDRIFGKSAEIPQAEPAPKTNACNLHKDCEASDKAARSIGFPEAAHCHEPNCVDCYVRRGDE